jgi:hypothetical protein
VKTYHCTCHAGHYSITDPPRGRIRRVSYPEIPEARPYPFLLDPASTRPRPTTGQQRSKAYTPQDLGSFHCLILYVIMVFGDGRPFSEHVAIAASTALDKTSLLRHPLASLPPLDPIKGQAGDSTKGDKQGEASHHPTVEDQHLKQSPLYSLSLRPRIASLSHSL